LPIVQAAARGVGYAIGLHGSMVRDLDLIAAPWTADAVGYDDLVTAIHRQLTLELGDGGVYVKRFDDAGPHGRRWANFYFQSRHGVDGPAGVFPFIDLSIMPVVAP
jgi:hypothetical protein